MLLRLVSAGRCIGAVALREAAPEDGGWKGTDIVMEVCAVSAGGGRPLAHHLSVLAVRRTKWCGAVRA